MYLLHIDGLLACGGKGRERSLLRLTFSGFGVFLTGLDRCVNLILCLGRVWGNGGGYVQRENRHVLDGGVQRNVYYR